jgi:hypothetical protein
MSTSSAHAGINAGTRHRPDPLELAGRLVVSLKRTLTIGAAGGALAAWFAAAATTGVREHPLPVAGPAPAIDSSGAALAIEIERLHERLRPTAAPRHPARNLFEFSRAAASTRLAAMSAPAALSESAPAVPLAPPAPALMLAGIAEDAGPDGTPVRTAIISAPGQLLLVKEGELATPRYRVVRVSADAVELLDLAANSPLRLVLK